MSEEQAYALVEHAMKESFDRGTEIMNLRQERDTLIIAFRECVVHLERLIAAPHSGEGSQRGIACFDARELLEDVKSILERYGEK